MAKIASNRGAWKEYYSRYPDLFLKNYFGINLNMFQIICFRLLNLYRRKRMTTEEKESFNRLQKATFGKWYEVTYIPNIYDIHCHPNYMQECSVCKKLRIDNINGWGTGTLFFSTEKEQPLVLNWAQIVSITPCYEKVKEEAVSENSNIF